MDSDDDFQQFSPSMIASPLIPERKLKRLKKSIRVSEDSVRTHFQSDVSELSTSKVDTEDSDVSIVQELEETNESWERRLEAENKLNSVHDANGVEGRVGAKRALDFLSAVEDTDNRGDEEDMADKEDYVVEKENEDQSTRVEEETVDRRENEFDKGRLILDVFEKEKGKNINTKNKEDKKANKTGDDTNFTATTSKIKEKKGRKELITELRAESQKLLRETRDASFKPIPMVAKSVSSVLEKIRKRKLELLKKSVIMDYSVIDNEDDDDDDLLERVVVEHNSARVGSEKGAESMNEEKVKPLAFEEDQINTASVGGSSYGKNMSKDGSIPSCRDSGEESKQPIRPPMDDTQDPVEESKQLFRPPMDDTQDPGEESKQLFRPPINDTQELFSNSHMSADDEIPVESPNRSQEEFLAPSILTMNLKLDSAPPDYEHVSDEEYNDKENVDPCPHRLADSSSSPIDDPVKAFVDDEAEEEDDSDNDMRFQDTEEEDDTDVEELNDMIATGYKEKPIDSERRNQLHQKWLENQDAVGTEKLMQKLKCGSKLIKESLLEDEDEEEEGENNVFDNEAAEDSLQPNARMNLRKMKQMVSQMFTDEDDTYFSDDEETERRLAQQCLVEKSGEKTFFLSPADDESCREVFGLIKKLNIVPETKKKTTTSFSSSQLPGGNKNISSKPSFLGRSSNQSLASSKKHGSNISRSFIFERDDNASRSELTIAEETHDALQKENKPARVGLARPSFSQSQAKSSRQILLAAQPSSGTSLFEILRQSSLQSKHCSLDNISYQSESVFEAFKLEKAPAKKRVKMEGRR